MIGNDALERVLHLKWSCQKMIGMRKVPVPREIAPAVITITLKIVEEALEVFMNNFLDEIPVFISNTGELQVGDRKIDLRIIQNSTFKMCGVNWSEDGPTLLNWTKVLIDHVGSDWYRPEVVIVVDLFIPKNNDDPLTPPKNNQSFVLKFFWENEPVED